MARHKLDGARVMPSDAPALEPKGSWWTATIASCGLALWICAALLG